MSMNKTIQILASSSAPIENKPAKKQVNKSYITIVPGASMDETIPILDPDDPFACIAPPSEKDIERSKEERRRYELRKLAEKEAKAEARKHKKDYKEVNDRDRQIVGMIQNKCSLPAKESAAAWADFEKWCATTTKKEKEDAQQRRKNEQYGEKLKSEYQDRKKIRETAKKAPKKIMAIDSFHDQIFNKKKI